MMFAMIGLVALVAPSLVEAKVKKKQKLQDATESSTENFRFSFFKWNIYKTVFEQNYCNIVELRAYEGQSAPNPPLIDLDGSTLYHLLDFAKKDRPLVVNFGSCS